LHPLFIQETQTRVETKEIHTYHQTENSGNTRGVEKIIVTREISKHLQHWNTSILFLKNRRNKTSNA